MLNTPLALGNLLFESPWPIVVGLVVLWALMRLIGGRLTGEREALGQRLRKASWAVLLVAAGVYGLAWYVQTPAERLEITMRQLLAAVEEEDWATFDTLVADDATGSYMGMEFTRARIDATLRDTVEIEDITLLSSHIEYRPQTKEGDTAVHLRVQGEFTGILGIELSLWGIHWRELPDGRWVATRFQHDDSGFDVDLESALQP
ncbi:MAG: nuclear transport factor 2 family protein [Planctomycetota bacterium]